MLAPQSAHNTPAALLQYLFFPPKQLMWWDAPEQAGAESDNAEVCNVKSCSEFHPAPRLSPICPLFLLLSFLCPDLDKISSEHGIQST